MRNRRHLLSLVIAVASLTPLPAVAADPVTPDPKLTPGAAATTDVRLICKNGYAKSVRHTSGKLKAKIYREYGIDKRAGHYEIDHLVPLSIGGADVAANLWPESYETRPWNAAIKDRLEARLHHLVCDEGLDIQEAQKAIAENWIDAYKKFCPTATDCPAYRKRKDDRRLSLD